MTFVLNFQMIQWINDDEQKNEGNGGKGKRRDHHRVGGRMKGRSRNIQCVYFDSVENREYEEIVIE